MARRIEWPGPERPANGGPRPKPKGVEVTLIPTYRTPNNEYVVRPDGPLRHNVWRVTREVSHNVGVVLAEGVPTLLEAKRVIDADRAERSLR